MDSYTKDELNRRHPHPRPSRTSLHRPIAHRRDREAGRPVGQSTPYPGPSGNGRNLRPVTQSPGRVEGRRTKVGQGAYGVLPRPPDRDPTPGPVSVSTHKPPSGPEDGTPDRRPALDTALRSWDHKREPAAVRDRYDGTERLQVETRHSTPHEPTLPFRSWLKSEGPWTPPQSRTSDPTVGRVRAPRKPEEPHFPYSPGTPSPHPLRPET